MKEKIIFTHGLIDLAQPRLGTKVIYKTVSKNFIYLMFTLRIYIMKILMRKVR